MTISTRLRWAVLSAALGAACLCTVACSFSTLFIIRNFSPEPAIVTLAMDLSEVRSTWCILEPETYFPGPLVAPASNLGGWWKVMQDQFDIEFDQESCTIALEVPPGHMAVVWEVSNYSESEPLVEYFPTSISVSGHHGRLELEGTVNHRAFHRLSREFYTLDYGPVP